MQNNGPSVSIGATRGESSTPTRPQTGPRGGGGSSVVPPPARNPDAFYPGQRTREEWLAECAFNHACAGAIAAPGGAPIPGTEQAELPPADPAAPAAPDPTTATIQDVAQFAPAPPAIVGEPGGMGVVGMPTNFVVGAEEHIVQGDIFDIPVTVRFTPVSYAFTYGDGAARETRTAGRSWDDLGVPQFTATATSHSYGAAGEYEAAATVRYAAEADAGGGWFPIAGLLEVGTPTTVIRIVDVETALVQRTCDEDPGGPGC
ncbi:hypothetical protein [Microbacterium oleivorans]|uniref:PKD domain-containing protein n=1 Tax=Microbacterium oleivorans TaxID=273677 RepID=A0A4R5YDU4_9MICO|nr:hypothetical protein [Microbacterium oleivorans]TDL43242.1 hypothetical protein E2R54_08340 [Microbacterium oleivorans]